MPRQYIPRRHRLHALCSYYAMLPEAFVTSWIEATTMPGDLVLDPCCGRGTVPFQALLMDRAVVGNDINPVAACITRAKTRPPEPDAVRQRLRQLAELFDESTFDDEVSRLPEFFGRAYDPTTLRQLLHLRRRLRWQRSRVDCMASALVLGSLHGGSHRSPYYFSARMPHTIATKPDYSIRYWQRHGITAPPVDVFEVLNQRVGYRYATGVPSGRSKTRLGDMRGLNADVVGRPVDCVITSPPYLDTTSYEVDQWLRLWFLGGPPSPATGRVSRDDRHRRPTPYWRMIDDLFAMFGRVMRTDGHIVIRIGGQGLSSDAIVAGLVDASASSGRDIHLASTEVSRASRR